MTMTTICFFFCQSNCVQNPCKNNATCQSGFTKKGYRCLCSGAVDYWMLKMIMIMTMIMTMTMICFFSVRAIVYKILVRTMLLVRADLQRKDIGVFVPLDLRVRFAKEVTITSVLISRGLQQFNGKNLLRCLLIGSWRIKELPLSSCSLKLSYWLVRTEGQQAFVAVSSPTQLNDEFCFFFCHFISSSPFSLFVFIYLLQSCTENGKKQ